MNYSKKIKMVECRNTILGLALLSLFELPWICAKELYIGAFLSMTLKNTGGWNSAGTLPAIQIAFEDINNCTEILKDYELKMLLKDSKCNRGYAIYGFVQLLQDSPQMVMILGGDCSASTESIAETTPYWNLVEVNYVAAAASLSDNHLFPLFLRTNQPEKNGSPAKIQLMKMFGWSRIATIQSSAMVFATTIDNFHGLLSKENFTRLTTEAFINDAKQQITKIKKADARIIYGIFYDDQARLVFCEAYKQGFYGPNYVWFLPGWLKNRWWNDPDDKVSCTPAQMKKAAGNYLSTSEGIVPENWTQKLPNGKTRVDVRDRYIKRANQSYGYNMYYTVGYDAVLAIALTLNKSIDILKAQGKSLENFTYDDSETSALFKNILLNLSFDGMSGLVTFDKNGDRIGTQYVLQLQGDKLVTLGRYDVNQDKIVLYSNKSFYWPGGPPPTDRLVIQDELVVVSFGIFVFIVILSSFGFVVAVAFLIFNVRNRNKRLVKMSSPRLNVMILMGCSLIYLVVPLNGVDSSIVRQNNLHLACQIEVWFICIGFTMSYGALFARTWRVHVIFTSTTTEKKAIKDRHLLGIVISLLVVDLIILTTWQILDPIYSKSWHFSKVDHGLTHSRSYVDICSSENISVWIGILLCYKGILLLFGAFLAWETRNVSYTELNDSRNIAISVYTILVSSMVGIPVLLFVKEYPDFTFFIASFFTIISTSLIIGLIFLPKIIALKKVNAKQGNPRACGVVLYCSSQNVLNPSYLTPTSHGKSSSPTVQHNSRILRNCHV